MFYLVNYLFEKLVHLRKKQVQVRINKIHMKQQYYLYKQISNSTNTKAFKYILLGEKAFTIM